MHHSKGSGTKVTVVGAGNVGSNTARRIAEKNLADEVVMIDIVEGLPQGLALDINQSCSRRALRRSCHGHQRLCGHRGLRRRVITAGLPRKPGMSRMDLLDKNAEIVGGVTKQIAEHSPDTILIVVSNPLDEMTYLAAIVSGVPEGASDGHGRRAGLEPASLLHRREARACARPRSRP